MNSRIVKKTHQYLRDHKLTIAVAESCTGGLVSKLLTDTAGSSKYFLLGVVAYSNAIKRNILKIPSSILVKEGAVSEKTAIFMARAARRLGKAHIGVSVTGIAGPGGGSHAKPVGTVFIAISAKNKSSCRKFRFSGDRNSVRKQAAIKTLALISGS